MRSLTSELRPQFQTALGQGNISNGSAGRATQICDTSNAECQISEEDVKTLQRYQLLQERWMYADEIERLNAEIVEDDEIVRVILGLQRSLCASIDKFIDKYPAFSGSKVAFGEIAVWNKQSNCFIPSSRLLKAILHNVGPWLLNSSIKPVSARLLDALKNARTFGAFDQYVCVFSKIADTWKFKGVARKVCPAKIALIKMFKITIEKGI